MNLLPEVYRGIEYIRISSLSVQQKQLIWSSFPQDKIIKIVRDQTLLNDCILFQDFIAWSSESAKPAMAVTPTGQQTPAEAVFIKLAFK